MGEESKWIHTVLSRTPSRNHTYRTEGSLQKGCVVCYVFRFRGFVGEGSVGFNEESREGRDGVRGWMAFSGTTQTISCHEIAANSTEYQPTMYTPHVIADMNMRPHLKYMGAGTGSVASQKSPCGPIRVAENDAVTDNDRKHYEHWEHILRICVPHPTQQQKEYPEQGTNLPHDGYCFGVSLGLGGISDVSLNAQHILRISNVDEFDIIETD